MSWQAHRAIEYGREVIGQSREELATALTEATGDDWSYQMVAKLEAGRKTFTVELLQAVANVQNLPFEWYLVDPRSKISGFRDSDRAIPGSLNSPPTDIAHEALILNSDRARVTHPIGSCMLCIDNPNAHVDPEWDKTDGLAGQTAIIIDVRTDEMIVDDTGERIAAQASEYLKDPAA